MPKIIVSYRRSDSAAIAGRIFDRFVQHYGKESVFMDIDNIPFGKDFRKHIQEVLKDSDIMIEVIGRKWLGVSRGRISRIKDPADPVRIEVETALRQGMTVIPVLVDGGSMPKEGDLPESLKDFIFLNAAPLDIGRDFHQHVDRLIRSIDRLLPTPDTLLVESKISGTTEIEPAATAAVVKHSLQNEGYDWDVFVSHPYVLDDDFKKNWFEISWIEVFAKDLRRDLDILLGRESRVWYLGRDFEKPSFDKVLKPLERAAIFLAVLSPNSFEREWPMRELKMIMERTPEKNDRKSRIIMIDMLPIDSNALPPPLRLLKRYQFGENHYQLENASWKYREMVDRLARDIADKLRTFG